MAEISERTATLVITRLESRLESTESIIELEALKAGIDFIKRNPSSIKNINLIVDAVNDAMPARLSSVDRHPLLIAGALFGAGFVCGYGVGSLVSAMIQEF